ncbi:FAD-dependent oxidoreductase [Arthrobacter sp. PAMC25564]|uniref:FAD-dependent oxidoreductase n=1 Tax=Arthrobacter sp. PAMC25564 TaxID=2565366 RepID=UPI0010A2817C|nr:FAD-dependent oxidoreductase [Arthrobacter sp. PAMC25564]QCB96298.1 FAD-dependent oxidoreductase [Arthrobacter sp. PAMC25564]
MTAPKAIPATHTLPDRVDVIIVGGGLAGCAAALAAAEAGASVLQLEKLAATGGSTVLSAGLSAFAGTAEQEAQGIDDSVDLLRRDILETGLQLSDPALVEVYCREQLPTYQWLKGHGVSYGTVHAASGQTVPRSHPTDTRRMLDLLLASSAALGVQLATGVTVERLEREDPDNGRVTGVRVSVGGETVRIRAGAVVLATGGFSQNPELLARFAPQMERAVRGGGAGSTGDGLLMAWQLGAGVIDTPHIKGTYGVYPHAVDAEKGTGVLAVYKGAIAVNADGTRFVDESLPYKVLGDASLRQAGGFTYQVFDAAIMGRSDDEVPIYDLAARERDGLLVKADTLAELAQRLDVPVAEFQATVERYNAACRGDRADDFGRSHLSGGVGVPQPIEQAPFFAHASTAVVLATYCGLTVTPGLEVLDVFGEPIGGLFAAGELIGGFHGGGYMTGTSIGKAGIFGRLAGTAAARLAPAAARA